jgi:phosphohistidine phosphatase
MQRRQLVVVRHAKSSWSDPDLADQDRPLNARGRRAGTRVGEYLREAGVHPDLVLCSAARRARQTLELLQLAKTTDVLIEDQLYGAGPHALLARLRSIPDHAASAMLIGHNPGVEELARMLVGDESMLPAKFPTGAVADIRLATQRWSEIEAGLGRLRAFITPRELDQHRGNVV